ncbi:Pvc16 family protein [Lentzea fradiae]|uniref:Pvc16 family protein n=1 Tax=Lentzea fradiae TaxID=200378 RepID=UPI0015A19CD7|nr:Pvc16 family protein [Lentzea fradiae]
MLADLTSSIHKWLAAELVPGTEIGSDPPALLNGIQRRPRRAGLLNLFLFAVTEDLDGLPAAPVRVRDGNGRVIGSSAPTRSYHLSYLVTAWAADTTEELDLLGSVIAAHAEQDCLTGEHLQGALRPLESALPVRLGWMPNAGNADLWGALGLPMRTALVLTVTAPALPRRLRQAAPPVRSLELEVHDLSPGPAAEDAPDSAPVSRRRWERTTITEH